MFTIPELTAARRPTAFTVLTCPHSGEGLNRHYPLVVATRNCPGCGRRVVEEPEGDGPPPLTPQQLDAAKQAQERTTSRLCWVALAGFLLWFAVVVAIALYRDTIRDAVRPTADPEWVFVVGIVLPLLAGLAAALLLVKRAERNALRCPHCAAGMQRFGDLVRLTGNCWQCGRRLVEPLPEAPAGPLPAVGEFKAALRRLGGSGLKWSLGLLGALIVGFVGLVTAAGQMGDLRAYWDEFEARNGVWAAVAAQLGLAAAWLGGAYGLLLGGVFVVARRHRRLRLADPLLSCPHCRAELIPSAQVVASRRCPGCRRGVLADPEPAGVAADAPAG